MSGIFSVLGLKGCPIDPSIVRTMSEALAMYGTDGQGVWLGEHIGLGARIQHSTPESLKEQQPVSSVDTQVRLVFDGILDRRQEVAMRLGVSRETLAQLSDPQLVLAAYEQGGIDRLVELCGDFAVIVWDGRQGVLHALRDVFGIRPLFLARMGDRVLVSTSISALNTVITPAPSLNLSYVRSFLAGTFEGAVCGTPYLGIERIPAGHVVSINTAGDITESAHAAPIEQPTAYRSDADVVDEFKGYFAGALIDHARSAFPVALQVSGGVDSSSMATFLRKLDTEGRCRLPEIELLSYQSSTYPRANETHYLRLVEQACAPWPATILEEDGMWALRGAHHEPGFPLDEPEVWYVRRLPVDVLSYAASRGNRLVLSGMLADQLLNSGSLFTGMSLPALMTGRPIGEVLDLLKAYRVPFHELLLGGVLLPLVRASLPLAVVGWLRKVRGGAREPAWLRPDPGQSSSANIPRAVGRGGLPRQIEKFHSGLWQIFFATVSEASAKHGIYYRMPFLDRQLATMVSSLPGTFLVRDGYNKWILRKAMQDILPAPIASRKGGGICDDLIHEGLNRRERSFLHDVIRSSHTAQLGLVNLQTIVADWETYWKNPEFPPWDLINWLNLELWFRR